MKDWLSDLWYSIQIDLELAINFIITWFVLIITVAIILLGTILIGVAIQYILFKMFGVA